MCVLFLILGSLQPITQEFIESWLAKTVTKFDDIKVLSGFGRLPGVDT